MAEKSNEKPKMLAITLMKSRFGRSPIQRECIKALGLSTIRQVVYRPARPEILGLVHKIGFLLHVEEVA